MTLPTNDPKTGKQWRLILLAAVVSLSMGGVFAYRFAVRSIEEKIMATLGPQGEVRELRIALTGIEMAGLRIRAPSPTEKEAAWPAEDELRVERIVVTPSLADLLRLRIVLSSVRIEGAYVSLLRARNGKVMIVLSDGYPAASGDSGKLNEHLREVVKASMGAGINVVGSSPGE